MLRDLVLLPLEPHLPQTWFGKHDLLGCERKALVLSLPAEILGEVRDDFDSQVRIPFRALEGPRTLDPPNREKTRPLLGFNP